MAPVTGSVILILISRHWLRDISDWPGHGLRDISDWPGHWLRAISTPVTGRARASQCGVSDGRWRGCSFRVTAGFHGHTSTMAASVAGLGIIPAPTTVTSSVAPARPGPAPRDCGH